MSHIRPDQGRGKHRKTECRKGRHEFGETQNIGAGIARRVCLTCSAVTIDLTSVYELGAPVLTTHRTIGSKRTPSS